MKRFAHLWFAHLLLGFVTILLAGCGFELREDAQLPFERAYVDASEGSRLGPMLRQALTTQEKLAQDKAGAPVRIVVLNEQHSKDILSLSGAGKVREYRFKYLVTLQVLDSASQALIAPIVLQQTRDVTYAENYALAKETEEDLTRRNMEEEALRQALRRLAYVKR
jgi:LPS-assembly lipoprotein